MEPYHIRTEAFQGPLDLLLSLIEKRKLLINDISLSEVSSDYLTYLEQHPEFPIAEAAQFVLVGSTLLLIKSRSLLPVLSLTTEEQDAIADLEQRLRALDLFKTLGKGLSEQFGSVPLYARKRVRKQQISFSPLPEATAGGMSEAIGRVLNSLPVAKQGLTETTVKRVVSLEEMMNRLTKRINESMNITFREFAGTAPEGKLNLIVSFLAMLELVRQGIVRVEQEGMHGDIRMHNDAVGVPRYG